MSLEQLALMANEPKEKQQTQIIEINYAFRLCLEGFLLLGGDKRILDSIVTLKQPRQHQMSNNKSCL